MEALRGPWEIPHRHAPQWLLDAIEALVGEHGGHQANGVRTASPEADHDAFGNMVDGRETYMRDVVWRHVLEAYRESPIMPPLPKQRILIRAATRITSATHEPHSRRRQAGRAGAGGARHHGIRGQVACHHAPLGVSQDEAWRRRGQTRVGLNLTPDAAAFEKAEEKAKATGDTFEYLNIEQILALADPKWLIDKLVIEQSLGFIYGPPGSLKTFIALDIALSLATKQPSWWGYPVERRRHRDLHLKRGSGQPEIPHQGVGAAPQGAGSRCPVPADPAIHQLHEGEDVGKLLATVQAIAAMTTGPVAAVFVDTVSRVLPGAEENLQKDMTIFVAACDAVRNRFGATVIGIHHTNYAGGIRGSTVIPGAGDFLIETRREPGAMSGSIFAKKVKDAEDGWEQFFTVTKIKLGDIVGHTSLVVDGVDLRDRS